MTNSGIAFAGYGFEGHLADAKTQRVGRVGEITKAWTRIAQMQKKGNTPLL